MNREETDKIIEWLYEARKLLMDKTNFEIQQSENYISKALDLIVRRCDNSYYRIKQGI